MHAKMTRDRKKCFIATVERTIDELEADIRRMKDVLAQVSAHQLDPQEEPTATTATSASMSVTTTPATAAVTPGATPVVRALPAPTNSLDEDEQHQQPEEGQNYSVDEDESASQQSVTGPEPKGIDAAGEKKAATVAAATTPGGANQRVRHGFSLNA